MKTVGNIFLGIGLAIAERILCNFIGLIIGGFAGFSAAIYLGSRGMDPTLAITFLDSKYVTGVVMLAVIFIEYFVVSFLLNKWSKPFNRKTFISMYIMMGLMLWLLIMTRPMLEIIPYIAVISAVYFVFQPKYLSQKTETGA